MSVLKLFYVCLHFIVTYLHYFHVAFSELLDRLILTPVFSSRVARSSKESTLRLGANNNDDSHLLLQNAGRELKQLSKLPLHVCCVFAESEPNIDSLVNIVRWCRAAGINCISLYDHRGNFIHHTFSHIFHLNWSLLFRFHC